MTFQSPLPFLPPGVPAPPASHLPRRPEPLAQEGRTAGLAGPTPAPTPPPPRGQARAGSIGSGPVPVPGTLDGEETGSLAVNRFGE